MALAGGSHPRNYEIWYAYATGYNAALNRNINEAVAYRLGRGPLSALNPADRTRMPNAVALS
jgi:hypothetical protein